MDRWTSFIISRRQALGVILALAVAITIGGSWLWWQLHQLRTHAQKEWRAHLVNSTTTGENIAVAHGKDSQTSSQQSPNTFGDSSATQNSAVDLEKKRANLVAEFSHPARFAALRALVQARYEERDERMFRHEHQQTTLLVERDGAGKEMGRWRTLENVWFRDGEQQRQLTLHEDLRRGTSTTRKPPTLGQWFKPIIFAYPFTARAPAGTYRYSLAGVISYSEKAGQLQKSSPINLEQVVPWYIKIQFEPLEPLTNKVAGWVLVDPKTGEPVVLECVAAEPPLGAERVLLNYEYAPAIEGAVHIVRVRRVVTIKVPFFHRIYESLTTYSDYRPRRAADPTEKNP